MLTKSRTEVRSNDLTALSMVLKMKAKGYGVNLVVRELALTLSDYSCRPLIATHIVGVTDKVADTFVGSISPAGHSCSRLF